jgi:hypothetical protein
MRLIPTRSQRRFAAICHGAGLLAILFIYQMSNSRLSPENANSQVSLGIRYTGYLQFGATLQDDSVLLTVVWGCFDSKGGKKHTSVRNVILGGKIKS